jgi:hypothetical protein
VNCGQPKLVQAVFNAAQAAASQYSHPSVIVYSVLNESDPWTEGARAGALTLKALDRHRFVVASIAGLYGGSMQWPRELDLHCRHYISNKTIDHDVTDGYPWYYDEFCQTQRRLSWDGYDPGVWDQYGEMIETQWEHVQATRGVIGVTIWTGFDMRGVFTFLTDPWGRPTAAFWHVKKVYCPVRIAEAPLTGPEVGRPLRIPVENRSPFCALREYRFDWVLGDRKGTVTPDVPALGKGEIEIPAQAAAGQTLELTVTHPLGFVVNTYRLPIGPAPAPVPPKPSFAGALKLTEGADEIALMGEGFAWRLDLKTGLVRKGSVGERLVVVGGPALHLSIGVDENCRAGDPLVGDGTWTAKEYHPSAQSQWTSDEVHVKQTNESVVVTVAGKYPWANGRFAMTFDGAGAMRVQYDFVCTETDTQKTKSKGANREVGVKVDVTGWCDTLHWLRRARWTTYPEDHVGRSQGTAKLSLTGTWPPTPEEYHKAEKAEWDANRELCQQGRQQEIKLPAVPWSLAECPNGTHDFAATKYFVYHASLTAAGGAGVRVESDGGQSARCWVEGKDRLALFLGFSGSGSVRPTMGVTKRMKIGKNDKIEGTAVYRLTRKGTM